MTTSNNATKSNATPAAAPAKVLSPDELAEELMYLAQGAVPYMLGEEFRKAEAALETVKAKMDRAGQKKLRILRAKSIEEAEAILNENPADVNLKLLCQKRTGWKPLQEKGASDEQLEKFLGERGKGWPEVRPYPCKMPSAEIGWSGRAQAWVDPDKGAGGNAHLSGQKLVDAVRRVMGIPKPAAKPPAKPAAAPTPAKKKTTPKGKSKPTAAAAPKSEPAGGEDDDEAGGADGALKAFAGEKAVWTSAWYSKLGMADARLIDALLSTQGNREAFLELMRIVASDDRLREVLGRVLGDGGGPGYRYKGGKNPSIKVGSRTYQGQALVSKVRELLEIPPPKPQTMPLKDLCTLHPPAKPKPAGGVQNRPQTWGQWAATLRGIKDGFHLSPNLPDEQPTSAMERFMLDAFARKVRPADARDQWLKKFKADVANAIAKDEAAPPAAAKPAAKPTAGKFTDTATVSVKATLGASIEIMVGKLTGPHPWRAGCYVVLSRLNNRALHVPLSKEGEPYSTREMAVRQTLQDKVRPFLDKLAAGGELRNDAEHKFVQDVLSDVILFLHDDPAADTSGRSRPAAPLPSVAALAKPRTPMPTPDDEDLIIPVQPHGQTLSWYQWRQSFAGVYHRLAEKAGLPEHEGVGEADFEPKGELLEMYNRGMKPAAAAKSYVDLLVTRNRKPAVAAPAKGDKPKEVVAARQAHDAVISAGGTFAQALAAGTKAIFDAGETSDEASPDARCRVCGCTEEDCRECIEAIGRPCWWVSDPIMHGDLCSRCKPAEYGLKVDGLLAGGGAHALELQVIGQGERDGHDCYQVLGFGGSEMWVRKAGSEFPAGGGQAAPADDPNVDGRGVYVQGVREIVVRGEAKGDKARIVIRVARGADGFWRSGHLLEFRGAGVWNADSDEPVKVSGQSVELEHYAVKARAHVLINKISAAPGKDGVAGATWTPEQRATYGAAIKALQQFIDYNPACKLAGAKKAKAG